MDDLANSVLDYLRNAKVMTLATSGPEGLWAAAVFYVNAGFNCYFLSSPATRHSKNIEGSAEVAATIQLDYEDWRDIKGVQMEGQVFTLDGIEKAAAIARYSAKFPVIQAALTQPGEISRALAKVSWYKLVPARLYFIDNSKGLGHRDEVDLTAG